MASPAAPETSRNLPLLAGLVVLALWFNRAFLLGLFAGPPVPDRTQLSQLRSVARSLPKDDAVAKALELAERSKGQASTTATVATTLLRLGAAQEAAAITRAELERHPEHLRLNLTLIRAQRRLGQLAEARARCLEALTRRPRAALLLVELATLQLEGDEPEQALETLEKVLTPSSRHADAFAVQARAREATGDLAGAFESLCLAQRIRGISEDGRRERARLLRALGREDEARLWEPTKEPKATGATGG